MKARRSLSLLGAGFLLNAALCAGAQDAGDPQRAETLIDGFVDDALQQGLLQPVGSSDPATGAANQTGAPAVSSDCHAGGALDFSELEELESYNQLVALRNALAGPIEGERRFSDGEARARNYLALNLTAEALQALSTVQSSEADLLRALANLLGGREDGTGELFSSLNSCSSPVAFWSALAALLSDPENSAEPFSEHLPTLRRLPPQMRIASADLALNALGDTDHIALRRRILAMFTQDELSDVPVLRFQDALLGLIENKPEAAAEVRSFLTRLDYRDRAIGALVRHGQSIDDLPGGVLPNDLAQAASRASEVGDLEQFSSLVSQLDAISRYAEVFSSLSERNAATPESRALVRQHILAMLAEDLESDQTLVALGAIKVMFSNRDEIAQTETGRALYETAALRAFGLGLPSLGARLAPHDPTSEALAIDLAEAAFGRQGFERVYELASRFETSARLNELAIRAAFEERDGLLFGAFAARMQPSDETILSLAEQAAAGDIEWIPSELPALLLRVESPSRDVLLSQLAYGPPGPVTASAVELADAPRILANARNLSRANENR